MAELGITSSYISITSILDGELITGALMSTKPLVQRLKAGTSQAVPDWRDKTKQPVIFPRAISQSAGKRVQIKNPIWSYNGAKIINNPNFEITTYSDGAVVVPALKIVGNLISDSNLNADTITFEGDAVVGDVTYPIYISTNIQLEELVGEPYDAFIEASNAGVITDENSSITLTAILYKGGAEVVNDITYEWYLYHSIDDGESVVSDTGAPNKLTLKESDIDGNLVVGVRFIVGGKEVYYKVKQVSDETDALFLQMEEVGSRTLKRGKSITLIPHIRNRVTATEVTGYNYLFRKYTHEMKLIEEVKGQTKLTVTFDEIEQNNRYMGIMTMAYK